MQDALLLLGHPPLSAWNVSTGGGQTVQSPSSCVSFSPVASGPSFLPSISPHRPSSSVGKTVTRQIAVACARRQDKRTTEKLDSPTTTTTNDEIDIGDDGDSDTSYVGGWWLMEGASRK